MQAIHKIKPGNLAQNFTVKTKKKCKLSLPKKKAHQSADFWKRLGGILSVKLNNSLTQIMNPRLSLFLLYL